MTSCTANVPFVAVLPFLIPHHSSHKTLHCYLSSLDWRKSESTVGTVDSAACLYIATCHNIHYEPTYITDWSLHYAYFTTPSQNTLHSVWWCVQFWTKCEHRYVLRCYIHVKLKTLRKMSNKCIQDCWENGVLCKYHIREVTSLLTYLLTYLLTPYSTVLLEKLTGSQLVKKFPAFYRTRRFITAFSSAHHLSLSWARSIQFTPCIPKWSPSFRFPHQNLVCTSPLPHTSYMPRPSHSSRFDHPNNFILDIFKQQFKFSYWLKRNQLQPQQTTLTALNQRYM